jgi:hypothetical protein
MVYKQAIASATGRREPQHEHPIVDVVHYQALRGYRRSNYINVIEVFEPPRGS